MHGSQGADRELPVILKAMKRVRYWPRHKLTALLLAFVVLMLLLWGRWAPHSQHILRCGEWSSDRDIRGVVIDHEEWCIVYASIHGAVEVVNGGGTGPICPVYMDVRFRGGAASTGHQLHFAHSDSSRFLLRNTTAYILVRKHVRECSHVGELSFRSSSEPGGTLILPEPPRIAAVDSLGPVIQPGPGVTVFTQLDSSRLPRLLRLANSIRLPISAAVLCDERPESLTRIKQLYNTWVEQGHMHNVTLTVVQLLDGASIQTASALWPLHR